MNEPERNFLIAPPVAFLRCAVMGRVFFVFRRPGNDIVAEYSVVIYAPLPHPPPLASAGAPFAEFPQKTACSHRSFDRIDCICGAGGNDAMYVWVRELAERRLPVIRSDPRLRWAAGLGLFVLAFVLRWALEGVLPVGVPFITFFIAILGASLLGGADIGLTVLGLSFVSSWYFFLNPRFSFELDGPRAAALLLFAIFGTAMVAIAHELNLTVERLIAERKRSDELLQKSTRAEERLAELNRELLHRIRNIFTLATSLASHTSRYAATPAAMAAALHQRFRALAVAQDLLVANELAGADLMRLARETLSPLSPDKARLNLAGSAVQLSPEKATSLCLVLHELATNAVKYGSWSNAGGTVDLEWAVTRDADEPVVTLQWREKGGPAREFPTKTGLGTLLIENAVAGAVVKRQFQAGGLQVSMKFALMNARHSLPTWA